MKHAKEHLVAYNGSYNAYRRSLAGAKEINNKLLGSLLVKYRNGDETASSEILECTRKLVHQMVVNNTAWLESQLQSNAIDEIRQSLVNDAIIAIHDSLPKLDKSSSMRPMTSLIWTIKNSIRDNIPNYTQLVAPAKYHKVAYMRYNESLDEVDEETGLSRVEMMEGDMDTNLELADKINNEYAKSILRIILNEMEFNVLTCLLGMGFVTYNESQLALRYNRSVDCINRIRRSAIDKIRTSEYFEELKELLFD